MKISGYTWASNVVGKLLPYEAAIRSLLLISDEVWVVYDPRYDSGDIFTQIDPRVNVISYPFKIEEITGNGLQLTQARKQCSGEWLFWADLDELIHEKDVSTILDLVYYANAHDYNCIELPVFSPVSCNYTFGYRDIVQWGIRPKFMKNIPGVIHGIPLDAIKQREDGNQYLVYGDGIDFVKGGDLYKYHALVAKDFAFLGKMEQEKATVDDVLSTLERFPYIYHYSRYSMQRKAKMNTHDSFGYFLGNTDVYEPEKWVENLGKSVVLEPLEERPGDGMLGPLQISHPSSIHYWLGVIDSMTMPKEITDG